MENWIGGACSVHGRHVKHTQNFNTETKRQINRRITKCMWVDNTEVDLGENFKCHNQECDYIPAEWPDL